MFFKKIPCWKIKRFLKRIISAIIFLSLLFSFSFPSYAVNRDGFYDSFDALIGDGTIEMTLLDSGSYVDSKVLRGEYENVDEIIFGSEVPSNPFDSFVFTIGTNSPNIQQDFSSSWSFILRQFIAIHIPDGVPFADYYKNFSIELLYRDSSDQFKRLTFDSSDFLSSHNLIEYPHGISIFFNIDLSTLLPEDGTIENIYYRLNDFVYPSVRISFYPSYPVSGADSTHYSAPLTFYVGSRDNAPLYPSVDDSSLNDLEAAEKPVFDFYNSGVDQFVDFYESFAENSQISFFGWVRSASEIFSTFFNRLPWQVKPLIDFLLIAGIFSFILSIAGSVTRLFKR